MHGMESVTSDTISELELAAETQVRHSDVPLRHKPVRGEYFSSDAPPFFFSRHKHAGG